MAELAADIFFSTIPELSAQIRDRTVTSEQLTRACAARLEKLGPHYNALALPLTEPALRQAREVDKEIKRGRLRGPLQGIPCGVKDLLSYAGQPTTWGAQPYVAQVFDFHATAVQKLMDVGAVVAAKLSMVELAGGGGYRFANASLTGPGLNPWNRARWSGGSSSGSAAAVAAGLVPFALGSETSGSILTPAAYCGVTGLRPTYGLVSRHGAMALSWTLDKIGMLARSAEDCALILAAIAGKDAKDPGSAGKNFYYTPQYMRALKEVKVGYAPVDVAEWADPPLRVPLATAMQVVKDTGVAMVETKLPDFPYGALVGTVISAEAASIFEPLISSGQVDRLVDQKQIAGLRAGLEIPAKDYLKAMRIRRLVQEAFAHVFSEIDVLVAPSRLGVATPIDQPIDRGGRVGPAPAAPGMAALIAAGNLAGLPALSLPCGFADGMPIGLQLVGPPFSENVLVAIGKEFQSRTGWHKQRPPIV